MNEALDALFDTQEPEPVVAVEPAPEPQPEAQAEPVVQAPAPEGTPAPVQQQEHVVPLPKYLDTRDQLKEANRRIADFEARQAPAQQPDPLDDPDGFRASMRSEMETQLSQQRFQMSDVMARQVHGAETVDQAVQWAAEKASADPMFAVSYMRDPNPIDWIVRQHKQDGLLSEVGADPVAFARKIAEREGWLTAPAAAETIVPAAQQVSKPVVPPRSLVTAPSAGGGAGHVPVGTTAAMEAIFPR